MKKNILIIGSIFTLCAHGMEEINPFSIVVHGTRINLNKGFILDTYAKGERKIDLIAVGHYEQETVDGSRSCGDPVGDCYERRWVCFKAREGSYDCGYEYSSYNCSKQKANTWKFPQRENNPIFVDVIEPRFNFYVDDEVREKANVGPDGWSGAGEELEKYFTYLPYETVRFDRKNKSGGFFTYEGDQAIKEASQDLALCYANVLAYGLENLAETKEKSIALPTLGTRTDLTNFAFPRKEAASIAVKSILTFIKNNPNAYSRIELFMEKQSELESYTELLMRLKKIYLLYSIYNTRDASHNPLDVPRDVINNIALLMFDLIR